MTATLVAVILRDMPDLPEDVAEQWLAPHAARPGYGWPPPDDGRVEPWGSILAGRPLSWWRERIWHREPLPMVFDYMSHATRAKVAALIEAAEAGHDLFPDSQGRLGELRACIAATGTWPRDPVAYPDADGLSLIDGYHRFAALLLERSEGRIGPQDRHAVWLALPPTGCPSKTG